MASGTRIAPAPAGSPLAFPDERIRRFDRTERAVHWVQATTFLLLLISGFVLALPQFEAVIGHRSLLREIHLSSAFFFVFGPLIVALAGDRGAMARDVRDVDTWDADDLHWLAPLRLESAPQGRFNAGQKLNAIFVAWSTVTFTVTGLILWQNRRFPIDVVQQANTIHSALAYVALAAFLGHLFLATAYPATRHAFHAITQGWVERGWAERHHAKWVRNLAPSAPPPALDGLRTALQILLGVVASAFAVRILFFALGANTTDKVTSWLYDATAWPGTAGIHPQTGVHITDWLGAVWLLAALAAWLLADQMRRLRPR